MVFEIRVIFYLFIVQISSFALVLALLGKKNVGRDESRCIFSLSHHLLCRSTDSNSVLCSVFSSNIGHFEVNWGVLVTVSNQNIVAYNIIVRVMDICSACFLHLLAHWTVQLVWTDNYSGTHVFPVKLVVEELLSQRFHLGVACTISFIMVG